MNQWKEKLLALMHDPPDKAYDYSPKHEERAKIFRSRVLAETEWKERAPDHAAAAADRFIFPAANAAAKGGGQVGGLSGSVSYQHPFQGGRSVGPPDSKDESCFPDRQTAEGAIHDALPDFQGLENPRDRHWLVWRLWMEYAATHAGPGKGIEWLPYLPADTRIPDGTIWAHNDVVSAIAGARAADAEQRTGLLLFQIGPVQEFIAQARSTRDLWSGSYLLSWMMAHALKKLTDDLGPDAVIFPSLKGQPLYDWLHRGLLENALYRQDEKTSQSYWETKGLAQHQELVTTPNFPNRFLAVVPADYDVGPLEKVFRYASPEEEPSEWRQIADACWDFANQVALPESARAAWEFQLENFWQVTWQKWPWHEVEPTVAQLNQTPVGKESPLAMARDVALAIPDNQRDARCYPNGELNPGFAWSGHYELTAHRLDARRQTRDFSGWKTGDKHHKDHFSGKEEVVATRDWLDKARRRAALAPLFRSNEELGAVNLVKRIWHKAYLEKAENPFASRIFKFESIYDIAARPWIEAVKAKGDGFEKLLDEFRRQVEEAYRLGLLDFDPSGGNGSNMKWLAAVDGAVLQAAFWETLPVGISPAEEEAELKRTVCQGAAQSLKRLFEKAKAGSPGRYWAVLALDGDSMGKWLSGEQTPAIMDLLSQSAVEYFSSNETDNPSLARKWLETPRHVSPSYHLQFSNALANFALYGVRRIVQAHHGQLIYAGGDDVLAMVPAGEALRCVEGLRRAFRGDPSLATADGGYPECFTEAPKGFIRLHPESATAAEPTWPLLVPGARATVSAGVSIGHLKAPLQDMIQEAQSAEKRAKNDLGRDAVAVTLFKRSGEIIHWGTKFTSPEHQQGETSSGPQREKTCALLELLKFFQQEGIYRKPPGQPNVDTKISGKFPYRLTELLEAYTELEADGKPKPLDEKLRGIALKEFDWSMEQQALGLSKD